MVQLGGREEREVLVVQVRPVQRGQVAAQGAEEFLVPQVLQEALVRQVFWVRRDRLARRGQQGLPAPSDQPVGRGRPDRLGRVVLQEALVLQVHKEYPARLEGREPREQRELRVFLARPVVPEEREVLARLVRVEQPAQLGQEEYRDQLDQQARPV